jgi:hypothetical protein
MPTRDIPRYSLKKHLNLAGTIAEPGVYCSRGGVTMMTCHESPEGNEQPCVGWLVQQLGPGNNIGLRILALDGRFKNLKTVGPQHERFDQTLPKKRRTR